MIILIAIEITLLHYNLRGLKLYNVLLIVYFIYNIMGVLSNYYKNIITSEYAFIFISMIELKGKYNYDLNKIPFVDKLELYNAADTRAKMKNKKGNSWYDSTENSVLELYIENYRNNTSSEVEEKRPKKNPDKPLHYEEREDGIYKLWEANAENLKVTIMKSRLVPFYSVYVKRYDVKDWNKTWYIEIASHKWFDLLEAKEIADKMKNIASKYTSPGSERTNLVKNLPTSLKFKETRDNRFWFTTREMDVDENCKISIIKSDREKPYSAYVKMHKKEHWTTQWYIEVSSHMWTTLSQAKLIVEKLYNLALSYKAPWIDNE